MTISSQVRTAGPFTGNGVATGGPFTFKIFNATEMTVVQTTDLGVDSTLVYGTGFSISLNADQNVSPGGTINYLIAGVGPSLIPTNYILNATSNVANLQPIALTNAGGFFPKVINDGFDRCTILIQQVLRAVNASLQYPLSDGTGISNLLPNKTARLGKMLAFDPVTGAPVMSNLTLAQMEAGSTAAAASAVAAAASAAAALVSQNAASTSATNAANSAAAINYRFCGTAGGTANALTFTPGTALASYTGALLEGIINVANTTEAMVANVSGLGIKNIKQNFKGTKVDPAIGMFQAGMNALFEYDGTDLVVVNAPWDSQASDIAAAATVALASTTGNFANLTGTGGPVTAITGLTKGRRMLFKHTGVHTLTNSGTLVLLSGANIVTAAGDISEWTTDGTNVYMTRYERANGQPLVGLVGALTGITSINGGQLGGFRNKLLNGAMQVWQRGTSGTTTSTAYLGPDRWCISGGATVEVIQDTSITAGLGFKYCAKVGRPSGSSYTGQLSFGQVIESINWNALAGKTVVLSCYAKCGANYTPAASGFGGVIRTGTGVDQGFGNMIGGGFTGDAAPLNQGQTLTTSWQKFSFTPTALSAASTEGGIYFYNNGVGTAGADDHFYVTGVQLEIVDPTVTNVGTPFEDRGFGLEFEMCRRYYQKTFSYATAPVQNAGTSTGEYRFVCNRAGASTDVGYYPFSPRMRTVNSVTLYNPNAANAQIRNISAALDNTASTSGSTNDVGTALNCTGNAGNALGDILAVHLTVDAEL